MSEAVQPAVLPTGLVHQQNRAICGQDNQEVSCQHPPLSELPEKASQILCLPRVKVPAKGKYILLCDHVLQIKILHEIVIQKNEKQSTTKQNKMMIFVY